MDSLLNPQKDIEKEISTGTTIMAVVYDKGVLIGCDSRTSSGTYVADRAADKIDYVHDKIVGLRTGSAADTQTLCRYVRYYISEHSLELGNLPHVKTGAKLFENFLYEYKDELSAAIIVAGWDPYNGPEIYNVPQGGTVIETKYALMGSGSGYIMGFVDANYRENMSLEEAKKLTLHAVSHAMNLDSSSGGIIRMMDITADKNERIFVDYKDLPMNELAINKESEIEEINSFIEEYKQYYSERTNDNLCGQCSEVCSEIKKIFNSHKNNRQIYSEFKFSFKSELKNFCVFMVKCRYGGNIEESENLKNYQRINEVHNLRDHNLLLVFEGDEEELLNKINSNEYYISDPTISEYIGDKKEQQRLETLTKKDQEIHKVYENIEAEESDIITLKSKEEELEEKN